MGGIVHDTFYPGLPGTMCAAINVTLLPLHPVPEDSTAALTARWSESMRGALKRIEMIGLTAHFDFEGVTVGVSTAVTGVHLFDN